MAPRKSDGFREELNPSYVLVHPPSVVRIQLVGRPTRRLRPWARLAVTRTSRTHIQCREVRGWQLVGRCHRSLDDSFEFASATFHCKPSLRRTAIAQRLRPCSSWWLRMRFLNPKSAPARRK